MRPVLYVLSFMLVMGLAFWAYRENYATQHQLKDMGKLQDEIASLREALTLQRAEWAYLNRPERLRDLATANFDRLGLLPLEAAQFGAAAEVTYPVASPAPGETGEVAPEGLSEDLPAITDPVEVSGALAPETQAAKPGDKEFP
ncbi:cell division protein FtsL [Paragemmobacter straminiformis]|uniref:Cell division protein FtsL n=1 Tax=Paragemmobacter straminiformis TaxID=2045119 RepID=A0A842ICC5_9RHOB|nr:cell division protein FtsL [Gemmobacter straminiformis]MBC2837281.1 cell division protein FtsL [Gemmobacter straminiformis]